MEPTNTTCSFCGEDRPVAFRPGKGSNDTIRCCEDCGREVLPRFMAAAVLDHLEKVDESVAESAVKELYGNFWRECMVIAVRKSIRVDQ